MNLENDTICKLMVSIFWNHVCCFSLFMMGVLVVIHVVLTSSGPTLNRDCFLALKNMATWSSVVSDAVCICLLHPTPPPN